MKHLKKITVLVVFTLVVAILVQYIFVKNAYATNLVLTGNTNGILITSTDEKLFNVSNMLPGESVSSGFSIQNNDAYAFSLSVRVVNLFSKTPENTVDLLDVMQLTASRSGTPMQNFLPSKEGTYQLGRFEPGAAVDIAVNLSLSGKETTNEYQGKTAKLQWIFTAVSVNPGTPTGPGGGGGGGGITPPTAPIPPATPGTVLPTQQATVLIPDGITPQGGSDIKFTDDGLPLGSLETTTTKKASTDEETLTEDETPLAGKTMPKTGETGSFYFIGIGSLVVIIGILLLVIPKKKNATFTFGRNKKNIKNS